MNAFTLHLAMAGKLNPKRRKQMIRTEKPRLGKVTIKQDGDLTTYRVKVNPPKRRRLTVNSMPRKK
ncbi:MAG: hypothetical protein HYV25_03055 [Candidatus Harrisonbacteria bacterium]|nr:hypothetical protein [Candidatus Harrisonbacteria bacterium]